MASIAFLADRPTMTHFHTDGRQARLQCTLRTSGMMMPSRHAWLVQDPVHGGFEYLPRETDMAALGFSVGPAPKLGVTLVFTPVTPSPDWHDMPHVGNGVQAETIAVDLPSKDRVTGAPATCRWYGWLAEEEILRIPFRELPAGRPAAVPLNY